MAFINAELRDGEENLLAEANGLMIRASEFVDNPKIQDQGRTISFGGTTGYTDGSLKLSCLDIARTASSARLFITTIAMRRFTGAYSSSSFIGTEEASPTTRSTLDSFIPAAIISLRLALARSADSSQLL